MASGNPPRHSKGKDKPVTIDLSAEPAAKPVAGDGRETMQGPPASSNEAAEAGKMPEAGKGPAADTAPAASLSGGPADPTPPAVAGPAGAKPARTGTESASDPVPPAGPSSSKSVPAAAAAAARATAESRPGSATRSAEKTAEPAARPGESATGSPSSTKTASPPSGSPQSGSPQAGSPQAGSPQTRSPGPTFPGAASPGSASPGSTSKGPSTPGHAASGSSGATSRLFAAGALGGIVALLLAGALQYGGVLPALGPQTASGETDALSARLDGLEQKLADMAAEPAPAADPALSERLKAVEDKLAAVSNAGAPADTGALTALNGEVEALRRSLAEAGEKQAATDAALSQRLEAAEAKLNAPRQDVAVARAIAAAGLKAAIDRGGPFTAELDTYANAAPDDASLAVLKSFAATGVPSRAELIRQAPAVASTIVKSASAADPQASWSDRLIDSARSLVTVRPVGNVEGDSVPDIAARLEDKVKNGDLPGAAEEWNRLPEPAKQASAAFKQSLDARIRVEDLISGSLSQAVSKTVQENAQ